MYRSILVGQDGCDNSRTALNAAIWLAGVTRAHLRLIHLHGRKLPLVAPAPSEDVSALLAESEKVCKQAGVACSTQLVSGWTTQALVNETKWHDLVVVGKHGVGWTEGHRGLGSVPTALLASSAVPVLVADAAADIPRQLLVVFDQSRDACAALRIAATMALERELELHVLEVVRRLGRRDQLDRAKEYLEDCQGLEVTVERAVGDAVEVVVGYIRDHNISLTYLPAMDRSLSGHKLSSQVATETSSSLVVPQGRIPPVY